MHHPNAIVHHAIQRDAPQVDWMVDDRQSQPRVVKRGFDEIDQVYEGSECVMLFCVVSLDLWEDGDFAHTTKDKKDRRIQTDTDRQIDTDIDIWRFVLLCCMVWLRPEPKKLH